MKCLLPAWRPMTLAALLATTTSLTAVAQVPAASPVSEPPKAAATEEPYSGLVIDGIKLSAQIQAGTIYNPYRPNTGLNFGQTITDRANTILLNQILLTAAKPIDVEDKNFQWGFKLQGMYGSDARYTQYLGIFNNALPTARQTFDIVEANAQFRFPVFAGGLDLKAGLYPTPIGYETIDPSTNPFYSHSYIFQFGLPFKHTGALTVSHVTDTVDIYAGIDTGANTTFGPLGDNNGAIAGLTGFGLNLMEGKLTILALTHFGPENATRALSPLGVNANGQWRFFNDVVVTYKATDALTLVTEFNWIRDAYGYVNQPVNGFGAAQYVSYALSDTLTLNARAEIWRDDNNFFVASFPGNSDAIRFQQGLPTISPVFGAPGSNTTYGALTLGVTYKPEVPAPITGLMIRPEIRWDHAYTSNNPFNTNPGNPSKQTKNAFMIGADIVLSF
ncbi:MAG: outer membrane beta-barrel protein [Acetobacteraceae bacterium]